MSDRLPKYARRLDALHRALVDDFTAIVAQLKLRGDEQIVDAGCGDGFFTRLLADCLDSGRVAGLDSSPAFLDVAGSRLAALIQAGRVELVPGDVGGLPFDSGSLDVVWSAHSMQSYENVPEVLAEFQRVLKPGGRLAVLESDALHSILLPWPPAVELAVREAERQSLQGADERVGAYFPRYGAALVRDAGFTDVRCEPRLLFRSGPLGAEERRYIADYVKNLLDQTADLLQPGVRTAAHAWAEACVDPSNPAAEFVSLGSLQALFTARRP